MNYRLGAHRVDSAHWSFLVWAPKATRVELVLFADATTETRRLSMEPGERGYHSLATDAVAAGTLYKFSFADKVFADPASRLQPFGVHGPSACVDFAPIVATPEPPVTLANLVIYELHVGTFTAEGTLAAAARELPRLAQLGITMVELMPLGEFPGARNWGYDGVFPFSVHHAYGGPTALAEFVRTAHEAGVGVMLDVVYNHVGPEGNYLAAFGGYFNQHIHTPWGAALNFDGPESDEVRHFFGSSAEQWVSDFDIDGLRFDAVHEIVDRSATPFLANLCDGLHTRAAARGKQLILAAESDANDPRYLMPTSAFGYGFDAMWCDDMHHALHVGLTGESRGYYADFQGLTHLARAWKLGASYDGQYAPSRRRRHGRTLAQVAAASLIVCSQNHDQIGNRATGDRLTSLADGRAQEIAAMVTLLSPYTPLLFMGEEYGEVAPFQYFVEHGDPGLIEAVRNGRREEFRHFGWHDEVPDPQAPATFERSRIVATLPDKSAGHARVLATYRALLELRRELAAFGEVRDASVDGDVLRLSRGAGREMVAFVNFGASPVQVHTDGPGRYRKRVDVSAAAAPETLTSGEAFALPGRSAVAYTLATST